MALYQEIRSRQIFQNFPAARQGIHGIADIWQYFCFSVAFERGAGDVLSQGTLVTSPWEAPQAQSCTQILYGFLISFPGE